MAENTNSQQNIDIPQVVGNVSIVNGTVQAESANGETRVLAQGAQIFANDRILTGENGAISIVFLDPGQTQLDLGRMSDMVLTEDVFQAGFPTDLEEATADIEQIQEALLSGDFDPTTDLEATAAGPAAGGGGERGGGRTIIRFDAEGREVTPESGAETTGIERDFSATDPSPIEEIEEPPVAAPLAAVDGGGGDPVDFSPSAGSYSDLVEERGLEEGTDGPDGSLTAVTGSFGDLGIDFGGDGPGFIQFSGGGNPPITVVLDGNPATTTTVTGTYGTLTVYGNSTWQYQITDNTIDHSDPNATGADDTVPDNFSFTVFDSDGDSATGTLNIDIYDDGPVVLDNVISRVVEEEAMDPEGSTGLGVIIQTTEDTSSVDTWSFTHNGGALSIDLLSELGTPGQDLDGDALQEYLDTQIHVFNDDGTLDIGDLVASNDDSDPADSGDGSSHSFDSLLSFPNLAAGNYVLVIGDFPFSSLEAVAGQNDDPPPVENGPYQIRLTGDVAITNVPDSGYVTSVPSLSDGNPDHNDLNPEDATQPDSAVVTGTLLDTIVDIGADNPGTFEITNTDGLPELLSQGETVYYLINGDTLEAWAGGTPPIPDGGDDSDPTFRESDEFFEEAEPRLVFTFQVEENGDYTFTLLDQLDHVEPEPGTSVENSDLQLVFSDQDGAELSVAGLDFSTLVRATDSDGDWVEFEDGTITFTIEDDTPIFTGASIHRVVEEEELDNDQSTGNQDEVDGPEDSWYNDPGMNDSSYVYGSLSGLVSIGSDEWPGSYESQDGPQQGPFSFIDNPQAPTGLTSQGETVWYSLNEDGTQLIAYAGEAFPEGQPAQDGRGGDQDPEIEARVVFTLDLSANGDYAFNLVDQLDHEDGDGENSLDLDFASLINVTDFDGDTINLGDYQPSPPVEGGSEELLDAPPVESSLFSITIVDDIPILTGEVENAKVDEDDLDTKLSTGTDDNDASYGPAVTASGSLAALVSVGADEPPTFNFADSFQSLIDQGLTSQSDALTYKINDNGDLIAQATDESGETRNVFKLELDDDGSYTFTLRDQLDHPDGLNENSLHVDFSGVVDVTDFDEDTVNLGSLVGEDQQAVQAFTVEVVDDIPILTGEVENAKVDEDDLDTKLSTGTDDNDAGYGPAVTASGSLTALVTVGADEPPTFNFADSFQSLIDQGLTSQSDALTYKINGDGDLIAQATDESGETRNVFKLELDEDGDYKFTLRDQLDHPDGLDENSLHVDFSGVVDVTDFDEDTINLGSLVGEDQQAAQLFTVEVVDDIPILSGDKERGLVDEDDLDTKLSTGTDGGDDPGYGPAVTATGSLSDLVTVGADEPLTFSFADNFQALIDQGLTSQSDTLTYKINGDGDLVAQATDEGGETRNVFKLELDDDGDYTFTLRDQLDHPDADGQNLLRIDLSGVIDATDFDQDTVNLGELKGSEFDAKAFIIKVVDDVPESEFTGSSFFVSEFAGYDNIIGTYKLDENGDPTDAKIFIDSTNDEVPGNTGQLDPNTPKGDYEEGTKFFLIANGVNNLDSLNLNNLQFVQNNGPGPEWVLEIDGSTGYVPPVYYMDVALNADGYVHFKDENGQPLSEVPPEGGEIRIEDLSLGDADYDDTVLRVQVGPSVDEANLPDGSDPDTGALNVSGNLFTGVGGLKITSGSDEPGTIVVNGNTITTTNTGGDLASSNPLVLDGNAGNSITVDSDAGQLVINGDGSWTYTLQQNTIVHPDNNPGGTDPAGDGDSDRGTGDQLQDVFDISFTDFDGDEITPQLVININDDGPEANGQATPISLTVEEDDLDSALADGDSSIGNNDDDNSVNADEASSISGSELSTLFTIGADNGVDDPGTVSYGFNADFSSLGDLTSQGNTVNYEIDGNQLIGYTGGDSSAGHVFTLTITDPSTGAWTFDLKDQLDHEETDNGALDDEENWHLKGSTAPDQNGIDFSSVFTATDTDGDTAYGAADNSFIIKVHDDIPEAVSVESVPANLNLVLILDTSGSMRNSDNKVNWTDGNGQTSLITRAAALQLSIEGLLGSLEASAADNIRIHVVTYNDDAPQGLTFDLKAGGSVSENAASISAAIAGMDTGTYTNYEAGLASALDWTDGNQVVDPLNIPGTENQVIFISDGNPNTWNHLDHTDRDTNDPDYALSEATSTVGDGTNEFQELSTWANSVNAIGIQLGDPSDALSRLDLLDTTADGAENINDANDLIAILPSLIGSSNPIISATVQEDDLTVDDDNDVDPDTAVGADEDGSKVEDEASNNPQNDPTDNSLNALFNAGADEPLSFSLSQDVSSLPTLYSGGKQLHYSITNNGQTLIATTTSPTEVIFTFNVVAATGAWHFDLDANLDHVNDANSEENYELVSGSDQNSAVNGIDLSALIIATDYDGDSVPANTGAFVMSVQDDVPVFETPQFAILANEGGNSVVADLTINFGADGPSSQPGEQSLQLSGPEMGGHVVDNNGTKITSDGINLKYVDDGSGGLIAVRVDNEETIFTVSVDPSSGTYSVNLVGQLDGGTGEFIDFTSKELDSGGPVAEQWISLDLDGDGTDDMKVRITGVGPHNSNANTINISAQGIGVIDQFVEEGSAEVLKFEFFELDGTTALTVDRASFTVDHLVKATGQGNPELLNWEAGSSTGTVIGVGNGAADDQNFDVTDPGGFDTVYLTAGGDDDGNDGYRVINMTIYSEKEAFDSTITYDIIATDGDGDTAVSTFDVTFDGDDNIEGTDAAEVISGSVGDDTITGAGGDDIIFGNGGNDLLFGGDGDDELHGGDDDDQLIGGDGADKLFGDGGDDVLVGDDVDFITPTDGTADIVEDNDQDQLVGGDGANDVAGDQPSGDVGTTDNIDVDVTPVSDDIDTLIPPPDPSVV